MARIRTVKPEFFRHEELQDCEAANAGKYPMLVFAGLWGHCDKAGRFEWRPRMLKLDILPFLKFEMDETLSILENAGFVRRYAVADKDYGVIESFQEHQRITGKELEAMPRYPDPPETIGETNVKQRGNNGETSGVRTANDKPLKSHDVGKGNIGEAPETHPESQEGKGKEGNGERAKSRASPPPDSFEVTESMADWAESKGLNGTRIMLETEKFLAHHRSKGSVFKDWHQAWQSWIFKAVDFNRGRST